MRSLHWANDRLRLAVTSECNLRCFYCHNEGQPSRAGHLPLPLFGRIVELLASTSEHLAAITFTGGEALLHPHLERFIEETRPFAARRTLVTNGWLLNEKRIRTLRRAGLNKIRIGVDSLDRPKSRPTPGLPSSVPIRDVLLTVLDAGLPLDLNVVVSRFNRNELESILIFCRDNSVSAKFFEEVSVQSFASYSTAGQMASRPAMLFPEFYEIATRVEPSLAHVDEPLVGEANEVLRTGSYELRYCRFLCDYGLCYATGTRIDANGTVYSCMRYPRIFRLSLNQSLERSAEVLRQVARTRCASTIACVSG